MQINREDLGFETVEGQSLRHGRETTTVPASLSPDKKPYTIVLDYWYAQDLQAFVRIVRKISGRSTETLTLRDIRHENPPVSLFHIPAGYTIAQSQTETFDQGFCPLP